MFYSKEVFLPFPDHISLKCIAIKIDTWIHCLGVMIYDTIIHFDVQISSIFLVETPPNLSFVLLDVL